MSHSSASMEAQLLLLCLAAYLDGQPAKERLAYLRRLKARCEDAQDAASDLRKREEHSGRLSAAQFLLEHMPALLG